MSIRRRHVVLGCAAAVCGAAVANPLSPERPIVIVDPATPGSSTDIFSRALAEGMSKATGHPVIVENKPGAAGALAAEYVASARPDGHTLGLAAVTTLAASPALNKALRYDPIRDFAPVTNMVTLPSATVVSADSPFRTLDELVAAARGAPGTVSYASPGIGSAGHILLEQFSHLAGVRFLHVPYRGSGPMYNDLFGGQLAVVSDNISSLLPHIRSGKVRALAIRDVRRIPQLPDVPVFAELGYQEVSYPLWFGLVAPAGTPRDLVLRLNEMAHAGMRTPGFQQRVEDGAATYAPSTPEEFARQIAQWLGRFRSIVQAAGIKMP